MSTMTMKDRDFARGDLHVTVRDAKTREVMRQFQIKNTITNGALAAMTQLLSQLTGVIPANLQLYTLRVGTGGTAAVKTQTALVAEQVSLQLSDLNKTLNVDPYEIRITATLEEDQGNDLSLQEAGLFLKNGVMFSRQTHPAIAKTSAIVLDYDWRIEFTA